MNGMDEKIKAMPIYGYIRDYISKIPVVMVKQGEYLYQSNMGSKTIFYILDGKVEVENVTYSGKKIVLANAEKDTFIGAIAEMHQTHLQSAGLAVTDVEALAFSTSVMQMLMENEKFLTYFYYDTCAKFFKVYKSVLTKLLFSPAEILSYYIWKHENHGIFTYKSAYNLCENIGISRRGIYNILCRFEKDGYIRKIGPSVYELKNIENLKKQAEQVIGFMEDN